MERYKEGHPGGVINDDTIQNVALPDLVEWLFSKFYSGFNDPVDQAIVGEFISQFMFEYANMEIFSYQPAIFRSRLYFELVKNKAMLTAGTDEYQHIFNANTNLTRTENTTYTFEESGKTSGTGSGSNTVNNSASGNTSSSSTSSDNVTTNSTGSSSSDSQSSDTNSNSGRSINSDYPQTATNLTLTPPVTDTWQYASTGGDQVSKGVSDGHTTTEGTNASEGKSTSSQGSSQTGESSSASETRGTNESSQSGTSSRTGSNATDVKADWDTISQFDRVRALIDFIKANPYSPIYKVISNLENLFIGIYTDQERWMAIDPETDLLKNLIKEG